MSEPVPAELPAVDPPAWLSDDAKGYWVDLIRYLPERVIKAADAHTFAMLCNDLATYAEADNLVQAGGIMITGAMGDLQANPALNIRERAQSSVARWYQFLQIAPGERAATARELAAANNKPGGQRHRVEPVARQ